MEHLTAPRSAERTVALMVVPWDWLVPMLAVSTVGMLVEILAAGTVGRLAGVTAALMAP